MEALSKKTADPSVVIPPNMNYEYLEDGLEFPLSTATNGFDEVTAWWMAEASLLAYEHPGFAKLVYRLHGFPGFIFHDGKSTESYIAYRDDAIILAFRGTEVKSGNAVLDIVTDMKFVLKDFKGLGRVHAGFADALFEVWAAVEKDLLRLKEERPSRRLFVCGHSLGGATATLAATLAKSSGMDLAALYTYGSPKVGDEAFSRAAPKEHFRLINYGDPIVQVPPAIPVLESFPGNFYRHSGQPWSFGEDHSLSEGEGVQKNLGSVLDGYLVAVKKKIGHKAKSTLSSIVSAFGKKGQQPAEKKKISPEDQTISGSIISMLKGTHLDAHAPVYYAINAWNALVDANISG